MLRLEPLEQLEREAGRFRLLEPHEEIALAQRIERGLLPDGELRG